MLHRARQHPATVDQRRSSYETVDSSASIGVSWNLGAKNSFLTAPLLHSRFSPLSYFHAMELTYIYPALNVGREKNADLYKCKAVIVFFSNCFYLCSSRLKLFLSSAYIWNKTDIKEVNKYTFKRSKYRVLQYIFTIYLCFILANDSSITVLLYYAESSYPHRNQTRPMYVSKSIDFLFPEFLIASTFMLSHLFYIFFKRKTYL